MSLRADERSSGEAGPRARAAIRIPILSLALLLAASSVSLGAEGRVPRVTAGAETRAEIPESSPVAMTRTLASTTPPVVLTRRALDRLGQGALAWQAQFNCSGCHKQPVTLRLSARRSHAV
jgi:hypothetical protein